MKPYSKSAAIVDGMVYLKVIGSRVEAYGDVQSLESAEERHRTGRLFDFCVTPEEWESASYTARVVNGEVILGLPQEFLAEQQAELIRGERYLRLRQCDKISPMRWLAMTEDQRQAWTDYRQALLDIPQQPGFPWGGDVQKTPWPRRPE